MEKCRRQRGVVVQGMPGFEGKLIQVDVALVVLGAHDDVGGQLRSTGSPADSVGNQVTTTVSLGAGQLAGWHGYVLSLIVGRICECIAVNIAPNLDVTM